MLATCHLLFPKTHKGFLVLAGQYLSTTPETRFRGRYVALMALLPVRQHGAVRWMREDALRQRGAALLERGTGCTALCSVSNSHFCVSRQVREQKEGTALQPGSMSTAQMNEKEAT